VTSAAVGHNSERAGNARWRSWAQVRSKIILFL